MTFGRQVLAAARLDLAEVRRSRWLWFCGSAYLILAVVFVLVGLRESTVMGFTGMGRVLMSLCNALLLILPLLALTAVASVIGRARDDGSLELLFSQPLVALPVARSWKVVLFDRAWPVRTQPIPGE